jgi:type IV secretion system protein VirB10
MRLLAGILAAMGVMVVALAAEPERDFSGKWAYSAAGSRPGNLPFQPEPNLEIEQNAAAIRTAHGRFALSGSETKYQVGGETHSSAVKWEGAALLINTLVSGPRNYVIMDRWRLSADRDSLIVTRHVMEGQRESEGMLVYRRQGRPAPGSEPEPAPLPKPTAPTAAQRPRPVEPAPEDAAPLPKPVAPTAALRPRPVEPAPEDAAVTVKAGTRILLRMLNTVDTKHSKDGDRVYLETDFPVSVDGRIVIPRGSAVTAVVSNAKQPGRVKGKGELYLRFDSLSLPNGVTRDFRSRLSGADAGARGDIDREEGKITSPSDKGGDARTVAGGAGVGAGAGGLGGAIGGNARMGTGIGAAAGAAAGLAKVLGRRGPDASIPRGTSVEMILDRDLVYQAADVRF